MKRITFFIIALIAFSTVSAQQGQQGKQEKFSKFYEVTVKPEIEKQQKEFFAVLTKAEIKDLKTLSLQADEIHAQIEENNAPENRSEIREVMMKLREQATKIADAHPEQSAKYRKSMSENMEKWKEEMPKRKNTKSQKNTQGRRNGQGKGNGQGRGYKQGQANGQNNKGDQKITGKHRGMQMMQQLTDPSWLLLWSSDRNPKMMKHTGRMGVQNPMMINPELKAEVMAYAEKNILPEIVQKRKLFDEKLSQEEKSQIAQAAAMLKTRNAMQKSYMESEDFDPGSRRNDPAFEAFREEMQKSMMKMKKIAISHSDEITEIRNNLKPQYDKWQLDIEKIFSKYEDDKFAAGEMLSKAFKQNTSPMAFILLDIKNPEFWKSSKGGPANGMHGNNNGNRNRF